MAQIETSSFAAVGRTILPPPVGNEIPRLRPSRKLRSRLATGAIDAGRVEGRHPEGNDLSARNKPLPDGVAGVKIGQYNKCNIGAGPHADLETRQRPAKPLDEKPEPPAEAERLQDQLQAEIRGETVRSRLLRLICAAFIAEFARAHEAQDQINFLKLIRTASIVAERAALLATLKENNWVQSKAALELGTYGSALQVALKRTDLQQKASRRAKRTGRPPKKKQR